MSWKCPVCGNDRNEDIRCICGYELSAGEPTTVLPQVPAATNSRRPQKNIKVTLLLLKLYTVISILVFLAGYYLFQIREMGLYLFMLFTNLPATVATIGVSEELASKLGVSLGSQPHILILEALSLAANTVLLTLISGSIECLVKRKKRRNV